MKMVNLSDRTDNKLKMSLRREYNRKKTISKLAKNTLTINKLNGFIVNPQSQRVSSGRKDKILIILSAKKHF
jgi:hypothetical protein